MLRHPHTGTVLECVPNVSEGRDATTLDALREAAGPSLLDLHVDADHHRSVFTLAGPGARDAAEAVRRLAAAVAERVDLASHSGVHPRLGALDVVPFVALDGDDPTAVEAARAFAEWLARTGVPAFCYDLADPQRRSLPDTRREAFRSRTPDFGPPAPHPRLGAVAVGARRPMVAVNCWLDTADLAVARAAATAVRARDGGLPGVRALGFPLPGAGCAQVSMNLVDLAATGIEEACTAVRDHVERVGARVTRVEVVGLVPAAALDRCSPEFRAWAHLGPDLTIEARLAAAGTG